jgi:hypothetical protein
MPAVSGASTVCLQLHITAIHTTLQDECIARMVDIVREEHAKEPRTLFVIGAYSIGKVHTYWQQLL